MARIAVAVAAEQVVTGLLVRGQGVGAGQEGIEFRRESTNIRRSLKRLKRLSPVVEDSVCLGSVIPAEGNRHCARVGRRGPARTGQMLVQGVAAPVEHSGPFGGAADRLGIGWPCDVK